MANEVWCCANQADTRLTHVDNVANNEVKISTKDHIPADGKIVDDDLSSVSVKVLVSKFLICCECYFH
jgi:hypothetical protein